MIENGTYQLSFHVDGKEDALARFRIEDGNIVFDSLAAKNNASIIPPGPISHYTHDRLESMLEGKDNHFTIKKIK
jgi:hypothetical protein